MKDARILLVVATHIFAIGMFIVGSSYLISAWGTEEQYSTYNASAAQMTQIWTEATLKAVMGIGHLLIAIFAQLTIRFMVVNAESLSELSSEVRLIKTAVGRMAMAQQKRERVP